MLNEIHLKCSNSRTNQEIALHSGDNRCLECCELTRNGKKKKKNPVCLHSNCLPPGSAKTQVGKSINSFAHLTLQLKSHVSPDAQRCFTPSTSLDDMSHFFPRVAVFLPFRSRSEGLEAWSSPTVNGKCQSASARHPLCVLVALVMRRTWSFASH